MLHSPPDRLHSEQTPLWETLSEKRLAGSLHQTLLTRELPSLKNSFMVPFSYSFDWNRHIHQSRALTTSQHSQEQLSFENTDVMAPHNCLSVLGVFNECVLSLILTVYFCFTAAFDLTVAGNSTTDLFICCTPAAFSKALLPQSFQAVQYNLPQSTFLFSFLPFNSPKVQGTYFST